MDPTVRSISDILASSLRISSIIWSFNFRIALKIEHAVTREVNHQLDSKPETKKLTRQEKDERYVFTRAVYFRYRYENGSSDVASIPDQLLYHKLKWIVSPIKQNKVSILLHISNSPGNFI